MLVVTAVCSHQLAALDKHLGKNGLIGSSQLTGFRPQLAFVKAYPVNSSLVRSAGGSIEMCRQPATDRWWENPVNNKVGKVENSCDCDCSLDNAIGCLV